jgi:hypothetical protein
MFSDEYVVERTESIEVRSNRGRVSRIEMADVGYVQWMLDLAVERVSFYCRYACDDRPDASPWSRIWHRITAKVLGIDRPWSYWWVRLAVVESIRGTGLTSFAWDLCLNKDVNVYVSPDPREVMKTYTGKAGRRARLAAKKHD